MAEKTTTGFESLNQLASQYSAPTGVYTVTGKTPLQRAADAIEAFDGMPCVEAREGCPGGTACPANRRNMARAVIEAIRDPNMNMILRCSDLHGSQQEIWRRSIDALLEEGR